LSDGTLAALGWTDELEAAFTPYAERGFEPARIVAEHRGGYLVVLPTHVVNAADRRPASE